MKKRGLFICGIMFFVLAGMTGCGKEEQAQKESTVVENKGNADVTAQPEETETPEEDSRTAAPAGGQENAQASDSSRTAADSGKETDTQSTDSGKGTEAVQDTAGLISEEKAKKIALKDAGVKEADVTGLRVRLETDDGVQGYEVDFYVGNKEYDYTIHASNGNILEKDTDIEDDFKQNDKQKENKKEQGVSLISVEEAQKIALSNVKGAKKSNIRIHLDNDDGKQIYEGSVVYKETEYDFEIDARTGAILEWEEESVYDD